MQNPLTRVQHGVRRRWVHAHSNERILRIGEQVAQTALPDASARPVVFFNASTRLLGLSLNAAFQQAAAWSVRLAGVPVVHFVCQGGMSRCVLGTDREDPQALPPCPGCIAQSRPLYQNGDAHWFIYKADPILEPVLQRLDLQTLTSLVW